jgi:hypothetical protein
MDDPSTGIAYQAVPLVDLTAVNAVQSLFTKGARDPWGKHVAADFVDFVVWNDRAKYPALLLADSDGHEDGIVVPPLLTDIRRRDPASLFPEVQVLHEPRQLRPELLDPALKEFTAFAINNAAHVKGFFELHSSSWIKDQVRSRFLTNTNLVFDLEVLRSKPEARRIAATLRIPEDGVGYLLDLVLKHLIYAEQAGGQYYLTHPIRGKQSFRFVLRDTTEVEDSRRKIPFRLGPSLIAAAHSKDQDWFTSRIHEARGFVREYGMTELTSSGAVGRDALRQLAAKLQLPARVRHFEAAGKAATVMTAAGGVLGSLVSADPWPAIAGSSVTIAKTLWSGNVGSRVSGISWLRWMFEWPLERETTEGQ